MAAIVKMFPHADLPFIFSRGIGTQMFLGKVLYKMYVIEFQKRGLPHAHILIKFERECV